jgi:hypothetical protein
MWRENQLQRIREEVEALRHQEQLKADFEKNIARIERQRQVWLQERVALRAVEHDQFAEFQRRERQRMALQTLKEKRELEQRKERLMNRRRLEEVELAQFKQDCGQIREDMTKDLESARETWKSWLELREEAAELDKEEGSANLEVLEEKAAIVQKEMDQYEEMKKEITRRQGELLELSLHAERRIEDSRQDIHDRLARLKTRQNVRL